MSNVLVVRVPFDSPCILWDGWKDDAGYGLCKVKGKKRRAHRVAWEKVNGPIPSGLVIDHLCRVRACVNVLHLEVVTRAVNTARGNAARAGDRTTCKQGHTWNKDNTRIRTDSGRACRICDCAASAKYRLEVATKTG